MSFCPLWLCRKRFLTLIVIWFLCVCVIFSFWLSFGIDRLICSWAKFSNFGLFSFCQDRRLYPWRVFGHSGVSYRSRTWVTLVVCVCLVGWSSIVCVCLFLVSFVVWLVGRNGRAGGWRGRVIGVVVFFCIVWCRTLSWYSRFSGHCARSWRRWGPGVSRGRVCAPVGSSVRKGPGEVSVACSKSLSSALLFSLSWSASLAWSNCLCNCFINVCWSRIFLSASEGIFFFADVELGSKV